MPLFLVWQMAGPMASWGRVAIGEKRFSDSDPTRSAIVGLLASCLGIERRDEDALTAISNTIGTASAVLSDTVAKQTAVSLRDYHIIQTAKPRGRKGSINISRAQELADPGSTILSERFYLTGGLYLGCAWLRSSPLVSLDDLAAALNRPVFAPYLGRRCCPPGLPFSPHIINASGCDSAMISYVSDGKAAAVLGGVPAIIRISWDFDAPGNAPRIDQRVRRRDLRVSMPYPHRSFAERDEAVTFVRPTDFSEREIPSEGDMFDAVPE